jgi:hypothetical protein
MINIKNVGQYFQLPMIGLDATTPLKELNDLTTVYSGDKSDESTWGRKLYLVFPKDGAANFTSNPNWVRTVTLPEVGDIAEFTIPEGHHEDADKIIEGKFSQVSRSYTNTHFPPNNPFTDSNNRILTKEAGREIKTFRNYWEELLGVQLPADAEVWPKPDVEKIMLPYELS